MSDNFDSGETCYIKTTQTATTRALAGVIVAGADALVGRRTMSCRRRRNLSPLPFSKSGLWSEENSGEVNCGKIRVRGSCTQSCTKQVVTLVCTIVRKTQNKLWPSCTIVRKMCCGPRTHNSEQNVLWSSYAQSCSK